MTDESMSTFHKVLASLAMYGDQTQTANAEQGLEEDGAEYKSSKSDGSIEKKMTSVLERTITWYIARRR